MYKLVLATVAIVLGTLNTSYADDVVPPAQSKGEFYLGGHVARPGAYSVTDQPTTILQAIANAGGEKAGADYKVRLLRRIDRTLEQTIAFNSLKALRNRPDADIALQPDDQVMLEPANP